MHARLSPISCVLTAVLLLPAPSSAFDTPLSPEAVRDAYFLGQHNNQSTLSFFSQYVKTLPAPDQGPYISEVEIYTPYTQIIEHSRRLSGSYSAQQADLDYRHGHDKLYVRVRINFTDTYGALELYRSAKGDKQLSGRDEPLPDFYRDFRVGLSQRSGPDREDRWIEPLRIILQPSYVQNSNHYPFIPEDLGLFSYAAAPEGSSYAYSSANGYVYPTGWLAWLVYDASDVASDDANVEVITTDGQHVSVPFDLSRLR
ncbi:MAG TPA: hypothetical protein VFF95_21000 [Candidatus Binatus sp.]|jgi:hypothetical protein|nr:hypothetical protein [Candidatus Binatus sp.]